MKIDHVGYLVKNLDKAKEVFLNLGFLAEGDVVYDSIRDINILFLWNGDYRVELVAPQSRESVVWQTLKKLGNAPYHICYRCSDMEEALKEWSAKGFTQTDIPQPAIACGGRKVCFLYHHSIGIIELIEEDRNAV